MKKVILLAFLLVFPAYRIYSAETVTIDGISYLIDKGDANIIAHATVVGVNYSGSVAIPSNVVDGSGITYAVTSIGNSAFYYCSGLTSITIPEGVTSIGSNAFYRCSSLTSITIPNSVTSIGDYAFSYCSGLTSLTIPNSVTSIGDNAFYGCTNLNNIKIFVTDYSAFCNNKGMPSLTIPFQLIDTDGNEIKEFVIPDGVTSIGSSAFKGCSSLTSITIPECVTSIGSSAFKGCSSLTSITIPNSVTSIGDDAFSGCSGLTSLTIPECVTSIGDGAFYNCSCLTSLTIPECVTSIGYYAFSGCSGLTSLTIPEGVTSIGDNAFYGCTNLNNIKIFVTDYSAFCNNKWMPYLTIPFQLIDTDGNEIKEFVIPDGVTSIGSYAFDHCCSLTSIAIPSSVTSIGLGAFGSCSGLASINIPEGVTCIEDITFWGCISLTSITIPNSIKSIGYYAFSYCSGLTTLTIPNSVTNIGDGAFEGCSDLTSITIPNSVTSIGYYAFSGCSGLTSITIPNSVTSIGYYAFSGCSGLDSVYLNSNEILSKTYTSSNNLKSIFGSQVKSYVLGDSIQSIGNYAFNNCSGLTSITIPSSVTSIGDGAFYNCSGLDTVYLNSNEILSKTYTYSDNLKSIFGTQVKSYVLGDSIKSIGDYAFSYCSGLTTLTIPECVTSIGSSAFEGCSDLTSITIPNSVTSIGGSAFYNCSGLDSVYLNSNEILSKTYTSSNNLKSIFGSQVKSYVLGDSIKSIGDYAFSYCSGLTSITIPECVTSIGSSAFEGCSDLTSITIPNSVTSIGGSAFYNCSGLDSVYLNSNTIVSKTYTSSNNLKSIFGSQVKVYVLGDSIKSIGSSAFEGCSDITSITIPECVTSFGSNAFSGCSGLTSITIHSSVTSIGSSAFLGCSGLDSVCLNSNTIVSKTYTSSNNLKSIFGSQVKVYVLGESIKSIGNYAFYSCCGLTSIAIPNNVTSIGDHAFYGCHFKTVRIGSGLLSIGNDAFNNKPIKTIWLANTPPSGYNQAVGMVNYAANNKYSSISDVIVYPFLSSIFEVDDILYVPVSPSERTCDALDYYYDGTAVKLIIPQTVKYRGIDMTVCNVQPYTFLNCSSLKEIELPINGGIGAFAFSGCSSLKKIDFGDYVAGSIGDYAFSNCSSLDSIVIKKGIILIGDNAFSGCSHLTTLLFNDGDANKVLTLGSKGSSPLFADCPLDSVYIGRNIDYNTNSDYGYSPFYRNLTLRSVVVTDLETEISDNAFYGCTNLKNVIVGDGVTSIGARAFSGCASLEKFSFGSQVSIIGEEAFSDCISLTEIKSFAIVPPVCGNQALDDINKWDCTLSVPKSSMKDYQTAEQWKDFFFIVKNEDYVDAVYQVKDRIVDVKIENETIIVSGMNAGDMVSVYQMNGNLISTKTAINGTVQISIPDIAIGNQLIIRIGKNTQKLMIM